MVVQMQVLSVDSVEMAPSLLLSTEAKRFMFNVGDGTQRLCMEHHVRLAKLQRVFLTELRTHTLGGLPGMVLTVSDTGKPELHVHGPVGTRTYLRATRHFLYRPEFKLEGSDISITTSDEGEEKPTCCYSDDEVLVYAVGVAKPRVGAKRKLHASPPPVAVPVDAATEAATSTIEGAGMNHASVSYVVETREQRGKFLVERAVALGVPKGKLFGQLHHGKDVTLADGRVVRSSDCVSPPVPASGCVIVSCPSVAHIDALVANTGFKRYQETGGEAAEVELAVVFHVGGVEVLRHPKYAAWTQRFGSQACHVLLGHDACAQKTVYRASAKLQAQLHAVFPRAFPSNEAHELRDAVQPFSRPVPDASTLELSSPSGEKDASLESAKAQILLGESMLKFVLAPQARRGFDASACWPRLDFEQVRASVSTVSETVTAPAELLNASGQDEGLIDGRITFLGTGCAIPSKYRNVTGMYLELPRPTNSSSEGDDQWVGMMLDCGEGSLGQLYRYANGDLLRLRELVARLQCVWVSHNHADHHLGLLRLLSWRADDMDPLLVIGPTPLQFWLEEYAQLDPTVRGKYSFVDSYCFDDKDDRFTDADTHAQAASARAWLRETLGVAQLECVPVKHAFLSYALVLTFVSGDAKLAFSGDCRPSDRLAAKAQGAFLLVHEATFEDDLADEAKQKAHCTTAEAIGVGRQAQVRHLLLTHFSQRYPKMPVLSSPDEEDHAAEEEKEENTSMDVLAAIDMLSLRFRELWQPQLMEICTQLMTQDDQEDGDDPEAEASVKAQTLRQERKEIKSLTR